MNEFDAKREGTGTHEWAEVTENIARGCPNNCLYCYAAHSANRFGLRKRENWSTEELTKRAEITSYPARKGVVMFPSSHDITPFNLDAYVRVARLILAKGNRLLIVSKPRVECIDAMLLEFAGFEDQILFRFTIGSVNEELLRFWEPGAPSPGERIESLRRAFSAGFKTSVSIEPIVGGTQDAIDVVMATQEYVTDTIWIGKMNKVRLRVGSEHDGAIKEIERLQSDGRIIQLYKHLQGFPKIRWKDSINEVISRWGL